MTCSKCKYLFSIGDTNNLWCDWREAYLKEYESDCDFGVSYGPDDEDETIVTNADRIRAMSDEELAEMHVGVGCPPGTDLNELCFGENGEELLCTPSRCRECWLKWLRKEADNG